MKKLWDNPELTVLVKRKPDEVILTHCHASGGDAVATSCFSNGASCQQNGH